MPSRHFTPITKPMLIRHRYMPLHASNPAPAINNTAFATVTIDAAGEYAEFQTIVPNNVKGVRSCQLYLLPLVADAEGMMVLIGFYAGDKETTQTISGGAAARDLGPTLLLGELTYDITPLFTTYAFPLVPDALISVRVEHNVLAGTSCATDLEAIACDIEWLV